MSDDALKQLWEDFVRERSSRKGCGASSSTAKPSRSASLQPATLRRSGCSQATASTTRTSLESATSPTDTTSSQVSIRRTESTGVGSWLSQTLPTQAPPQTGQVTTFTYSPVPTRPLSTLLRSSKCPEQEGKAAASFTLDSQHSFVIQAPVKLSQLVTKLPGYKAPSKPTPTDLQASSGTSSSPHSDLGTTQQQTPATSSPST